MKYSYIFYIIITVPLILSSCQSECERLRAAIWEGDIPAVESFLSRSHTPGKRGCYFDAFHEACRDGSYECVCLMLERGDVLRGFYSGDRNKVDASAALYLRAAMSNHDSRVLDRLMQHEIGKNKHALSAALGDAKNIRTAAFLMNAGADPLLPLSSSGVFSLCLISDIETFRFVLSRVNFKKLSEEQKVMLAKWSIGSMGCEKLRSLLERGLSPEIRIEGLTLYEYSSEDVPFETIMVQRNVDCAILLKNLNN